MKLPVFPPVARLCGQSRDNLHLRTSVSMRYKSLFRGKVVRDSCLPLLVLVFSPHTCSVLSNYRLLCSNFSTADYYPSDVAVSLKATLKAGLEFSFWSCIDTGSKSEGDFLCHHIFPFFFFLSMWSWSTEHNKRAKGGGNNVMLRSGPLRLKQINNLTNL